MDSISWYLDEHQQEEEGLVEEGRVLGLLAVRVASSSC